MKQLQTIVDLVLLKQEKLWDYFSYGEHPKEVLHCLQKDKHIP